MAEFQEKVTGAASDLPIHAFFYYFSIDFFNNLFNVISVYKTPCDIIQTPLGHLLIIMAIIPFA